MPRLRISERSRTLPGGSKSGIEGREHARTRVHLFAESRRYPRSDRQVHVNPRAKAYESESLAARQAITSLHVTQYPPGNQSRNLNAGDVGSGRSPQPQRVALVLQGCFVQVCVDETA